VKPVAFAVEDGDEHFVVVGDVGWLSFIAGYTRFPDPRRKRDGWDVLEPADGETLASLRPLLNHGIFEEAAA
jgi:hypothetical protein